MTWPLAIYPPLSLSALGRVIFILLAAYVGTIVLRRAVGTLRASALAVMMRHAGGAPLELEKRANTIIGIALKTLVTLMWSVAVVIALAQIGFDITPILAGAGVVGLAVGFGAQNLVRDVISGFFMLIENQIRVNDVAVINGTGGLVEEVNLRTTVLRSLDGTVHIFPNGTITTLSNMTLGYSYYVFDIPVAYHEDTDRVTAVVQQLAAGLREEAAFADAILEPLEVMGVDQFADSAVIVKARIKTQPLAQWLVGREMNRRIKKRFDELGIEIPFPQRTLHNGGGKPLRVQVDAPDADQIRRIVREVVEEMVPRPGSS
ncbi:MAG: mechanosensitive ion channel family protein [Vicinamibacterales bacterium]